MKNLAGGISTPSMAVALTALFIALSGNTIALPGENRVDKNDYKRGSVGSRAIANNSIRAGDIRNGTLESDGREQRSGHWTDGEGTVHLQGVVGGGTAQIFTLPPEARPSRRKNSSVPCFSGVGLLFVSPDGSAGQVNVTQGGLRVGLAGRHRVQARQLGHIDHTRAGGPLQVHIHSRVEHAKGSPTLSECAASPPAAAPGPFGLSRYTPPSTKVLVPGAAPARGYPLSVPLAA